MYYLNSIIAVMPIFLLIILGMYLCRIGIFKEEHGALLSKIINHCSLPLMMFAAMIDKFTKEKLISGGIDFLIPFISILISILISIIVCRVFKIDKKRQGIFKAMFFGSNTVLVGIPITLALFGEEALPYALMYYVGNTTLFWTIGVYFIGKDGDKKQTQNPLKKIFSPPLLGYLTGLLFVILGIKVPDFILVTARYAGNLTTPLSMFFLGISLYYCDKKEITIGKDNFLVYIGRFIVSPLTVILVCMFIPAPKLMKNVFIIQSAMATMVQGAVVAKETGADYKFASISVTLSTIISLIVLPIYYVILN